MKNHFGEVDKSYVYLANIVVILLRQYVEVCMITYSQKSLM